MSKLMTLSQLAEQYKDLGALDSEISGVKRLNATFSPGAETYILEAQQALERARVCMLSDLKADRIRLEKH